MEDIPLIDLQPQFDNHAKETEIVKQIGEACENNGFFAVRGHGISEKVIEHCDFLGEIPMQGNANSLNVSAAVSAILFKSAFSRITKLFTVPLETATIFAAAICSKVPSHTAIKS